MAGRTAHAVGTAGQHPGATTLISGNDVTAPGAWEAPSVSLEGARAVYVGPALDLAPHRNTATTVALALSSPFQLSFLGQGLGQPICSETVAAIIPSGTRHHLVATGGMAFIYLDPLSDDTSILGRSDLAAAHAAIVRQSAGTLRDWRPAQWCEALGVPPRAEVDARIAMVVRRMDDRPDAFRSAADAAAAAGMSITRFHVRFRNATGTCFRQYRIWRRLAHAMQAIAGGQNLTSAALDCGFSSSAHFSSAFRMMFGLPPSGLLAIRPTFSFRR
jgi:AraC-like DNA-binding protein